MLLQTSLGINIENVSVSMAYLKTTLKGVSLAAHAFYPLENTDPVQKKVERVRALVRDFMDKNQITSTDIFLGIPRDLIILRYIKLPLTVKENLRETLGYEMEKYTPFSVDKIYFDFQIISEDKESNSLQLCLAAGKKESIDPYFDLRHQLATGISGIGFSSTAITNYFSCKKNIPDENTLAFVYLKDDTLELSLIKNKFLTYSKQLEISENHENLQGIILQEAGPLKEALGDSRGRLKTVFFGPDMDAATLNRLGGETELEIRSIDLSGTDIPSCAILPAYGLALKGIKKVPMDINLLPEELRKKAGKLGYYMLVGLAVLLILSILAWGGGNFLSQKFKLDNLNSDIQRLETEIADIDRIQTRCNELETQIDFLNALRGEEPFVLDIIKELSQRIPDTAWIRRLKFSDKDLQLKGYAKSASELIPLLEASPLFKDVAFLSPITKSREGKEIYRIGLKAD